MNCNHVQEKLFDFCEGKLLQDETLSISKHSENCSTCKALIGETKNWVQENDQFKKERMSPFLADKIISKLKEKEIPVRTLSPVLSATFKIAAVLVIAISAGIFLNTALQKNANEETSATETVIDDAGDTDDPENLILTINE